MAESGVMPDGPVTIMFTDLEGSTALRTRLGDVEADALFGRHDALVRDQIAIHGGHEQGAALGDGFLAVFTSTRRAIACAIAVQNALDTFNRSSGDARLKVRVGLNTGEVAWNDGQLSGEAVHAAARVCAAASGGQILVADVTRQLAGTIPDVTFRDAGEFELKGFPQAWRLWEIVWVRDTSTAPEAVFVGRDAELAVLRSHLHHALDGSGGLVLVGGEPGVGKTTLVRQLIHEAERSGALAVFGRCYESEGAIPYAPFVEMLEQALAIMPPDIVREDMGEDAPEVARMVPELRRRFPDIGDPLDLPPEQQRRYFFNAVGSFITRGSARFPLLMVIDDIHWADEPTLLLTEHMASLMKELRVLGVATYRDVELDLARPLAGTVERLVRNRLVDRLPVRRFDRDGVATMIERLAGAPPPDVVVDSVFSETEGNPFFVEEVYRHLVEDGQMFDDHGAFRTDLEVDELDVPESVRLVVGRRLERLGPEVQRILAAGAVVGRGFPFRLLEHLVDVGADAVLDAVEAAEAAQVIVAEERDGDVHYSFGHELIRQTLLSGLSVVRRQRLHLAVADAIEATDGRALEERPSEIAGHLLQAGAAAERDRTLSALELTADRAFAAAAFEEALRAMESAIDVAAPDDALVLARLRERQGRAVWALGDFDESIRIWDEVIDVYAEHGLAVEAGQLCLDAGYQRIWLNQFEAAFATYARGLAIVGDEATSIRARLLGMNGALLGLAGFYELAEDQLDQAEAIAQQVGDARALGRVLWGRAMSQWVSTRGTESIPTFRASIEALRSANDQWTLVDSLTWASYPLITRGTPEAVAEGRQLAAEGLELSQRLGHRGGEALAVRGEVIGSAVWAGDLEDFERVARRDLELFSALGSPWRSQSHVILAQALLLRGDVDGALGHARSAAELEPTSAFSGVAWSTQVVIHAWRGDVEECVRLIDERLPLLPPEGIRPNLGTYNAMMSVVEAGALLGLRPTTARLRPLLAPWADDASLNGFDMTLAQRVVAMSAAASGDWDDATDRFERSLRHAGLMPNVLELARTRYWFAEMLLERGAAGDGERADAMLTDALELFERIGAPLYADRVRTRLTAARATSQ